MKDIRLSRFAWLVLAYNLAVVLWGAYVRATGSGAGCGRHWPLCNGEVVPRSPRVETLIEFTHRITSGLALILVVTLFIWAWKQRQDNYLAWQGAKWAMIFMILESLVGASLVLFELVAYNPSAVRAAVMAVHLLNTLFLLASIALTAWWASGYSGPILSRRSPIAWLFGVGLVGIALIGTTGAITALGDTLFPAESLRAGLEADISPTAHFLIRLRVIHPLLAILIGGYMVVLMRWLLASNHQFSLPWLPYAVIGVVIIQVLVGFINVLLLAPVPIQLIHLFLADLLWLTSVLSFMAFKPQSG